MPVALSGMITSTFCHIGKEDLEKSHYVFFFYVVVIFIYSSDSSLTSVSSQNSTELLLVDGESLMQNLPNSQGRKHSLWRQIVVRGGAVLGYTQPHPKNPWRMEGDTSTAALAEVFLPAQWNILQSKKADSSSSWVTQAKTRIVNLK